MEDMSTRDLITACRVIWTIRLRLLLIAHGWTPRSRWTFTEHQLDCAYRACVELGLRGLAGEILALRG
jgi:hypothetical protein